MHRTCVICCYQVSILLAQSRQRADPLLCYMVSTCPLQDGQDPGGPGGGAVAHQHSVGRSSPDLVTSRPDDGGTLAPGDQTDHRADWVCFPGFGFASTCFLSSEAFSQRGNRTWFHRRCLWVTVSGTPEALKDKSNGRQFLKSSNSEWLWTKATQGYFEQVQIFFLELTFSSQIINN